MRAISYSTLDTEVLEHFLRAILNFIKSVTSNALPYLLLPSTVHT